ncbi:MAG: sugar 3,4-ketoisomerase [Bdellovibrionota bacterium]
MENIDGVRLISLKSHVENGVLVPVEAGTSLPFEFRRIFYVYDVPEGSVRGEHAHHLCKQVLVCMQGEIVVTCDDGQNKRTAVLNSPTQALYLPPMIWGRQVYRKPGSILMVFTDQHFDAKDYIRDYNEFLSTRRLK